MVWVELRQMGQPRKEIRGGSAEEGVKEVEEAERLNHDVTCSARNAKSDDRRMSYELAENMVSIIYLTWKLAVRACHS